MQYTTFHAPLTSEPEKITPDNVVTNSLTAVNNLRAVYQQALADQAAAWKRYSDSIDEYYEGKIARLQMEENYQAAYAADLWVHATYEAYDNANANHLDLIECGCIMDQSYPICRALAARVWTLEA